MKTSLDHLPDSKRRRIEGIAELLQREAGVIMVILFGSYARGDWVEDPIGGYFSDFDILAIVAQPSDASDRSLRNIASKCPRALGATEHALAGRNPRHPCETSG